MERDLAAANAGNGHDAAGLDTLRDGVFDQRDAWAIARERKALLTATSRSLEQHVWLDGAAWRAVALDPHGRSVAFERFDPGCACKSMDQWVYTSAPVVVAAAAGTIAVKVDGDQHRDLTKHYGVSAYPTMLLLLDQGGTELRRAIGYRSVAQMVEFLQGRSPATGR